MPRVKGGGGVSKETVILHQRESLAGNLVLTTELKMQIGLCKE